MKTAGIIAEYNPFHQGHLYQMQYTKEALGADYIVVAMSGDYVQRGTPALLPKHVRARMALLCGADLILELPASVSSASAEFFAQGGVSVLDELGVIDLLCFGSEEGELPFFLQTADILIREPDSYKSVLQTCLKSGMSFPCARSQALLTCFTQKNPDTDKIRLSDFLSSPNNILGIEYCKALLKRNSKIMPVTLKREGAAYHETKLEQAQAPSASGIRSYLNQTQELTEEDIHEHLLPFLPEASLSLLMDSFSRHAYLTVDDLDILLHYCLLGETPETLCQYPDISADLAARIIHLRNQYRGFIAFAGLLKTKELTRTRIQRALLHIVLGIKNSPLQLPYARVLGFRKSAGPLLKAIKKEGKIPLITKLADASRILDREAMALLRETTYTSGIYESLLCQKAGKPFVHEYEKPVIII
mgnify:CR=1 FL=1